jgi:hypothetical protein
MKHNFPNNCLAAHLGGGSRGQGGAQQGTRARGEQYLDGASRSHTLAAGQLFGITNTNNPSAPIPFFRSKPTKTEDEDENEDDSRLNWVPSAVAPRFPALRADTVLLP